MIHCFTCGYKEANNMVYCTSCGAKLDLHDFETKINVHAAPSTVTGRQVYTFGSVHKEHKGMTTSNAIALVILLLGLLGPMLYFINAIDRGGFKMAEQPTPTITPLLLTPTVTPVAPKFSNVRTAMTPRPKAVPPPQEINAAITNAMTVAEGAIKRRQRKDCVSPSSGQPIPCPR